MAPEINGREFAKFVLDGSGNTAVLTKQAGNSPGASTATPGYSRIEDGTTATLASVDGNNQLRTNPGAFSRTTDSIDPQWRGTPIHTIGTVTAASSTVLAANASRRYLMIQNVSASDVWINIGGVSATTAAPSIKLIANTGVYTAENGYIPTSLITAISSGSVSISVIEG